MKPQSSNAKLTQMLRQLGYLKLPLHVLTGGCGAILLLVVAGILAWHAYSNTRQVMLSSVDESMQRISEVLKTHMHDVFHLSEEQMEFLANSGFSEARSAEQRLAALPIARAALSSNPLLDAFYVGYPNGEFILFRNLRTPELRQVFRAPAGTQLLVQMRTLDKDGNLRGEFRFYNEHNQLVRQQNRPDYTFDPRTRPWYQRSLGLKTSQVSAPYIFFTTRSVGVTLARDVRNGVVVGLDTTLDTISQQLGKLRTTPGSHLILVNKAGELIANDEGQNTTEIDANGEIRLQKLPQTNQSPYQAAFSLDAGSAQRNYWHASEGRDWEVLSIPLSLGLEGFSQDGLRILMTVPHDELFRDARRLLHRQLFVTLLLIAASVPAGFWFTQQITQPLRTLAADTHAITTFDFSPTTPQKSRIAEVDLLANATRQMKSTIARFLDVSAALNSETRLEKLLEVVLKDVSATVDARSGALYLLDDTHQQLRRTQDFRHATAQADYPLNLFLQDTTPVVTALSEHQSHIGTLGSNPTEIVAIPLETLSKELVGSLILELPKKLQNDKAQRDPELAFIEALSSTAAVAIETRHLVDSQKQLLEALIQLLAGAIDAKSPYTGGHCQRVPELTKLLAKTAHDTNSGPLKDFKISDEEWEAIHVGAWLHDCGKITTPEAVVDKATKLEAIYNRIHEVRTRFEVLKRDAEIHYWRKRSEGTPEQEAWAALRAQWQTLDEEFTFVAECNVGSESMDPTKIERLTRIAQRPWQRTLDDRLGLSREELRMVEHIPAKALPSLENLLADKAEHRLVRPPITPPPETVGKFNITVPANVFNRGELYNLSIRRGTLTEEERFIINDHIVQTIEMLERLPFPRHLKSVPEIAGGHHERMDGRGYPRGLKREQMSIPARIMAIADVFEALTAADRPYKPAKTLSESLAIMAQMVADQHLDPDLFALFLDSGAYRQYAERYLNPAQLDTVDMNALQRIANGVFTSHTQREQLQHIIEQET